MGTTNLREAEAKIEVAGILSEKNLEVVEDNGKKSIKGTMTIQTDEFNFIKINVYTSEKTKDGKINKAYKGLETVMKEYVSVAENGVENATLVTLKGQIKPESYIGQDGSVIELLKFSSNYFNRPKASDLDEDGNIIPKDNFSVEIYIKSLVPEIYKTGEKQGEETGRLIINGYLPMYDGKIEPIQLVAPTTDDIANAITDLYSPGQTGWFSGNIVSNRVTVVKEIPVVIGKPKTEITTTYINELLVSGATAPYEEDTNEFNKDAVTAALADRETRLEESKAESSKGSTSSSKTTGKPKTSGRKLGF